MTRDLVGYGGRVAVAQEATRDVSAARKPTRGVPFLRMETEACAPFFWVLRGGEARFCGNGGARPRRGPRAGALAREQIYSVTGGRS